MCFALAYSEPWLLGGVRGSVVPAYERGFEVLGARTYTQRAWVLPFKLACDFTYSQSRLSLTLDNTWTTDYNVVVQDTTTIRRLHRAPRAAGRWRTIRPAGRPRPRRGGLTHLSSQLAGSTEGGQGRYEGRCRAHGHTASSTARPACGCVRPGSSVSVRPRGRRRHDPARARDRPLPARAALERARLPRERHRRRRQRRRFLLNANVEARFPIRGDLSAPCSSTAATSGARWTRSSSRMFQATGQDGTTAPPTCGGRSGWASGRILHRPLRLDYGTAGHGRGRPARAAHAAAGRVAFQHRPAVLGARTHDP